MTNKSTKKALLLSVLSLVVCISMLVGTTFAWFTDSVTSSGNRIVAGNLKVDLLMDKTEDGNYVSIANGSGDIFSEGTEATNATATLWEPGKTQIVYLAVQNSGTLDLKYNIVLEVTDGGLVGALEYAVIDGAKAADIKGVATDWATLSANAQVGDVAAGITVAAPNGAIEANADTTLARDYFALAVHMKEEADNQYQGKDITIDVTVQAAQLASEEDSFGSDYDTLATFDNGGFIIAPVEDAPATVENGEFTYTNEEGTFTVSGLDDDTEGVNVSIKSVSKAEGVAITADKLVNAYDIKVTGYEPGTEVKVSMFVGTGLNNVVLYHEGVAMAAADYDYDSTTGILTFTTTSFSVYAVEYTVPGIIPLAKVSVLETMPEVQYVDLISGEAKGTETLDIAYLFETTETYQEAQENEYAKWHADFVVTFNKDVEAGTAGLAGSYDSWQNGAWVAFEVPDVDTEDGFVGVKANTPVRLLQTAGICMNYEELCLLVEQFRCGAFDIDGANAGTTITVELRLYEVYDAEDTDSNTWNDEVVPENYDVVGVYHYTF